MAFHQREICKVGESPTQDRRSLSPRRGSAAAVPDESAEGATGASRDTNSPTPGTPKMSPSSSACTTPETPKSPSRSERRISTRLLMMQGKQPDAKPGAKSSPKHQAWKSSKFFSRSMASGELLKGFKKLSASSAAPSSAPAGEEAAPGNSPPDNKDADSKSFKSRFSSLRRKSGSDTDNVPNVDSESLKLGSPDVRGIVCKKEDLISLMKVPGTKERRVSSPAELIVPLQSSLPTSPIPVLKSPSIKVAPNSPLTRGSFRTSRSNSLDPTALPNVELRPPFNRPAIRTVVYQPPQLPSSSFHHSPRRVVTDDICIKKTGTFLEVVPEVKRRLSGPLIEVKDRIKEENEDAEGDSENPVQWDDSNFVDPNLLGGAIEAFLKGMGTSPTATPTTEKRVSFKKNLIK